jgi:hypothetical protein
MQKTRKSLAVGLLLMSACAVNSFGAVVNELYTGAFPATITGVLPNQGTALAESFDLLEASDVTIYTTSYGMGGFQPNLTLFDGTGMYVATGGISGTSPIAIADPSTGLAFDSYLKVTNLGAGRYTIALTDFLLNQSITATNLSDGFTSNFGSGVGFTDVMGNTRSANYSLVIETSSVAPEVPEPATGLLVAPLLVAAAWYRKRRQTAKH